MWSAREHERGNHHDFPEQPAGGAGGPPSVNDVMLLSNGVLGGPVSRQSHRQVNQQVNSSYLQREWRGSGLWCKRKSCAQKRLEWSTAAHQEKMASDYYPYSKVKLFLSPVWGNKVDWWPLRVNVQVTHTDTHTQTIDVSMITQRPSRFLTFLRSDGGSPSPFAGCCVFALESQTVHKVLRLKERLGAAVMHPCMCVCTRVQQ